VTSSSPPHLGTTVSFIVTTASIVSPSLVASVDNVDSEVDFETSSVGFDANGAMLAWTTVVFDVPPIVRSKTTTTTLRRLTWLIIRMVCVMWSWVVRMKTM